MSELILTTYDWVPDMAIGFVRDLRVRWALEEAGLPYRMATTPFHDRAPDHLDHQPFNQVPWLTDNGHTIFETGAILLHLGEKSDALLSTDPIARSTAIQWVFAAQNSLETAVLPKIMLTFAGGGDGTPYAERVDGYLTGRLTHIERILTPGDWLAGDFSIADILMADILRLLHSLGVLDPYPACRAYIARATARPAFLKAHADQLAHFNAEAA